ncbi:MAG: V4R domain-containing protein [Polyangiaceae bacterium]
MELHDRSDQELDTLPFGVIGLTRSGRILRYNLAEARFARLDRAQVLGRAFYEEVAPCCATPEFKGRIDALFGSEEQWQLKFDYVFDFRFGAQLVDVEVIKSPDPNLVYVCINRRSLRPSRSSVPPRMLAAEQAQLAPRESELAVRRDALARRCLDLHPVFLEAFHSVVGTEPHAAVLLGEWGVAWGRRMVIEMETEVMAARDAVLRELTMEDAIGCLVDRVQQEGWGRLSADFAWAPQGAFVVELERNALAEALPRGDEPRCHLLAGYLSAFFSHIASRRLVVGEASCIAAGADRCRFVVVGPRRGEALARAIEEAGGNMAALGERLAALSSISEEPAT